MGKPLPSALLLLLCLGCTAGAGRDDTCPLGLYGARQLEASEEPPLRRAPRSPTCPGKTGAADPPAKETSRPWIRLGAWAQEVTRSPTDTAEAGILLMEGEQCNKWVSGEASPIETFHCPTRDDQWEEMFCCGTCKASYCCSSPKERLDQRRCPEEVVRTEGQEPEEPAEPTVKENNIFSILEFIIVATGLTTSFTVFFCALRSWTDCMESRVEQRVANAQVDLIREIPAVSVIHRPRPERAASSAGPDPPSCSVPEESPELPPAGASTLWASGNPIRELMRLPAFILRGPLEVVPEEEIKEEEEEEEEEETTYF